MNYPFETDLTLSSEPKLSIAEFEALPEHPYYRFELVRGRVVREPPPMPLHARIQARLSYFLYEATEGSGDFVLMSEAGFAIEEDPPTVRGPDLAVVRKDRVPPNGYAPGYWHLGPDIVIEINSPSNRASQIQDKVLQYLAAGVRQIWVIDPPTRSVTVHCSDGESRLLRSGDVLDGGDVLPRFKLSLTELFKL